MQMQLPHMPLSRKDEAVQKIRNTLNMGHERSGSMNVVTGTGPRKYQNWPLERKRRFVSILAEIIQPYDLVISGGAEGFDTALAVAAISEGKRLELALPNPTYVDYYWRRSVTGTDRREAFGYLASYERAVITHVCSSVYEQGEHSNLIRNRYMIDAADTIIIPRLEQGVMTSGTQHAYQYAVTQNLPIIWAEEAEGGQQQW